MINLPYRPNWAKEQAMGMTCAEALDLMLKRKEENRNIPIGEVVFYIKKHGDHDWKAAWGTIADHYPGEIVLDLYEVREQRVINGINYEDYDFSDKFKQLPKDWNKPNKLLSVTYRHPSDKVVEILSNLSKWDIESYKKVIDMGYYVKSSEIDHTKVESEVVNGKGYRIIRKGYYVPTRTTLHTQDVYKTYEEVERAIQEHYNQLHIEANMTDEEWAVYELDNMLANIPLSDTERAAYRKRILEMENFIDYEFRYVSGVIEWKHWKNIRWNKVEL